MTNINNLIVKIKEAGEVSFYTLENTGWSGNDWSWFKSSGKRYSSKEDAETASRPYREKLEAPTLHRIVHTNIKVTESQKVTTETYYPLL
jgi:hypothetical protein